MRHDVNKLGVPGSTTGKAGLALESIMKMEAPTDQPTRSRDEIERRAYHFWEDRGRPWGTPETHGNLAGHTEFRHAACVLRQREEVRAPQIRL